MDFLHKQKSHKSIKEIIVVFDVRDLGFYSCFIVPSSCHHASRLILGELLKLPMRICIATILE